MAHKGTYIGANNVSIPSHAQSRQKLACIQAPDKLAKILNKKKSAEAPFSLY